MAKPLLRRARTESKEQPPSLNQKVKNQNYIYTHD
ncbi:hypothetical protein CCACVL1_24981 [Corchorus capsularis]|uniref:Uncharacterized protein n=1 Tax=Corchorus capsularis TaxID=210143 RepID=A0A1R3GMF6_COCAP|nr:hypothetical protein CCACVL1_24981 [Corchorus capsularis]